MQLHLVLGALGALLVQHATAAAAPAWCKAGPEKPTYNLKTLFGEADATSALVQLVAAGCYPEAELAPYAKQLETLRQMWSKRLFLTEADWSEVSEWAHLPRGERNDDRFFPRDRQAAWSSYSALDQFAALRDDTGGVDLAYIADAFGAKLTQPGRLAYVRWCLERKDQDDGPVVLAMCAADAAALDAAKLAAEISADRTHGVADRMAARIVAYETLAKLPQWKADVTALRAKDPAYDRMFVLARGAHDAWAKVDAGAIALAAELDDARVTGSRRASAGCVAKSRDAWQAAVKAIGAKRVGAIHGQPGNDVLPQLVALAVAEPAGYLAGLALHMCARLESAEDALTQMLGAALVRWPGFRGPRTGTQAAILTADLKLDRRDQQIAFPDVARPWIEGNRDVGTYARAVVSSVKVEGEHAIVTFAKQKVRQTRCTRGHYTSRISQIMSDGTVVYYYQCDAEVQETVEVAPAPPAKVHARYAAGVKAGMTAVVSDDVLVVAYDKAGTPAIVTGVEVK